MANGVGSAYGMQYVISARRRQMIENCETRRTGQKKCMLDSVCVNLAVPVADIWARVCTYLKYESLPDWRPRNVSLVPHLFRTQLNGCRSTPTQKFSIGYINWMIPSNQVPRLRQACRTVDGADCQQPDVRHNVVKDKSCSPLSGLARAWERPRPLVSVSGTCYPEEHPGVRTQL